MEARFLKSSVIAEAKSKSFKKITDTGGVGYEQWSVGARLEDDFLVCGVGHLDVGGERRFRSRAHFQLPKLEAFAPKKSHDFDRTRWANSTRRKLIVKSICCSFTSCKNCENPENKTSKDWPRKIDYEKVRNEKYSFDIAYMCMSF